MKIVMRMNPKPLSLELDIQLAGMISLYVRIF